MIEAINNIKEKSMKHILDMIIEQQAETTYFFQETGFIKFKDLDDKTQLQLAKEIFQDV